jgi:hypothetical protein
MKEKLNLTNLTKMTKKNLQETRGGHPPCACLQCCTSHNDLAVDTEAMQVYTN